MSQNWTKIELGSLKKSDDLRKVWEKEYPNFTGWLSEHLDILADELNMEIELIDTEAKAGSFSTDILAYNPSTDKKIIIENQLESTDHDHLGKIIIYASGHDANTIIWIVKEVREEYRSAIDWLNEHTDEGINIFLCKIELWQIDDSKPAPKFQIVSKPNDWSKLVKREASLTESEKIKLEYWRNFQEFIINKNKENEVKLSENVTPTQFTIYTLSVDNLSPIQMRFNFKKNLIQTSLFIPIKKEDVYKNICSNEKTIKKEWDLNEELIFDDSNDGSYFIRVSKDIENYGKNAEWENYMEWQYNIALKLIDLCEKYG